MQLQPSDALPKIMLARFYSNGLGRFLGVDPVVKRRKNSRIPQRWNRFVYSLNNPIKFIDPDGREIFNTATDPTTKSHAAFLSSSPDIQKHYGGKGRDLIIRNRNEGEAPIKHPSGALTTGVTNFESVEQGGKIVNVKRAEIVIDPTDPNTGEARDPQAIRNDVRDEFGHAALGVENPERHAAPGEDHHDEAAERGAELEEQASQQGEQVEVKAEDPAKKKPKE